MPVLLIAGLLGGIYFFMPTEYDKLMHKALMVKNENPKEIIFDEFPEPPMPNRLENEKTNLGIDTDNNGIRDDIDIWINRTGKSYNERMALRQMAKARQLQMKYCELEDHYNGQDACQKAADAYVCMSNITEKNLDFFENSIREMTENTRSRQKCMVYFAMGHCSSELKFGLKLNNCEFKVQ